MEFTAIRKLILGVFIATVILVVYGSLNWGWGTLDMAATYLICAMICAAFAFASQYAVSRPASC